MDSRAWAAGAAALAAAWAAADDARQKPTPKLLSFRVAGESNPPVQTTSFVVGETGVFAFAVGGVPGGGRPRLAGGWSIAGPDERSLPADNARLTPAGRHARDPSLVMLSPTPGVIWRETMPAGCYRVRLTVTDEVSGATFEADQPIFLFLSAGARDLVPDPEPKSAIAFDEIVFGKGFWGHSLDVFAAKTWSAGFAWADANRGSLRSAARQMTFLGQPVVDATVRIEGERPAAIDLSLYNRGDVGEILEADFTNRVGQAIARLQALMGQPPQIPPPAVGAAASKYKSATRLWKRATEQIRLEYAWSTVKADGAARRGFQPEFIRVSILPTGDAATVAAATPKIRIMPGALANNVRRTPDGDVYLDSLPMVNQGEKGYCAAAAGERVMEYYGADVDQHALAQRMAMQAGGVQFDNMVRGLGSVAQALGLQVRMLIDFDEADVVRMIEDYNKTARKMNRPPLDLTRRPRQDLYAEKRLWERMAPDVFLASRIRERVAIDRSFQMVRDKINAGIPLCHCAIIGILPEEAKLGQPAGGHLRLIIGYNETTRDILYTDSWGPGHERKRMPMTHAFAITTGLFTLEPR